MNNAPAGCSHTSDRGIPLYADRLELHLHSLAAFLIRLTGMRLVDLLPSNENGRHIVVVLGKRLCQFRMKALLNPLDFNLCILCRCRRKFFRCPFCVLSIRAGFQMQYRDFLHQDHLSIRNFILSRKSSLNSSRSLI